MHSSCGFQQGDNIGITSSTCRHCTLSNSIMCSDSYPIPSLSPFFLYHPYIPYFCNSFFLFSSLLPHFTACMHVQPPAPKIGLLLGQSWMVIPMNKHSLVFPNCNVCCCCLHEKYIHCLQIVMSRSIFLCNLL